MRRMCAGAMGKPRPRNGSLGRPRRRKRWEAPIVVPDDMIAALNACATPDAVNSELARLDAWLDERHGHGAGQRMLLPMLESAGWTVGGWYSRALGGMRH